MTMVERIPAGQFKARCLSLLDEVAASGRELIVTKRGIPVAKVVPVETTEPPSLIGSILREDDIVSPIGDMWEADS